MAGLALAGALVMGSLRLGKAAKPVVVF